jgi:predicted metal-dependent hydrolase
MPQKHFKSFGDNYLLPLHQLPSLIKAPEDIIDYNILHELCHLKIKEHSHNYWNLVRRYVPDYQEKINWLNIKGAALI